MRYILGVKIHNKMTKEENDFLCIFSFAGYPSTEKIDSIKNKLEEGNKVKTLVFCNAEAAQEKARQLAKNYRRDDVWKKEKQWEKSKRIITFYPLKIDNNKFPFLVKETKEKTKSGNTVYVFKKKDKKHDQ